MVEMEDEGLNDGAEDWSDGVHESGGKDRDDGCGCSNGENGRSARARRTAEAHCGVT